MSCTNGGVSYSDGALICSNGRELRCDGGAWQETGYSCFMRDDANSYTRISGDEAACSDSSISSDSVKRANDPVILNCCRMIRGAPAGYGRVYNNCGSCMEVTTQGGDGDIKRTRVPAQNYVDVAMTNGYIEIIGEGNC